MVWENKWVFSLFFQVSTPALQMGNALNSSHLRIALKFSLTMCDGHYLGLEDSKKQKGHLNCGLSLDQQKFCIYVKWKHQQNRLKVSILLRAHLLGWASSVSKKEKHKMVWHWRSPCLHSTVVSIGTINIFSFRQQVWRIGFWTHCPCND